MDRWRQWIRGFGGGLSETEHFLWLSDRIIVLVAKALSLLMVGVILVSIFDLSLYLTTQIFINPSSSFGIKLTEFFGLFLNVLIAIEILENITAYLRDHVVQVELVVVTSLIAVARKIILFDFQKNTGFELLGLAAAALAMAASYWLIRQRAQK